jgi:glutaredoxin
MGSIKSMITVFVIEGCPYCARAIDALRSTGSGFGRKRGFGVVDVDRTPGLRARLSLVTGCKTFPSVWVGGVYIGGLNTGPAQFGGLANVINTDAWHIAEKNAAFGDPILP